MNDYAYWTPPEPYEPRKVIADLQDEVTRLRAAMPCDALREYDRRKDRPDPADDEVRAGVAW